MHEQSTVSRPREAWAFCHRVLPGVSRTFALNIPVLPPPLRDGVCCAYLLCRIADTIEDSEHLDPAQRRRLYDGLCRALAEGPSRPFPTDWSVRAPPAYVELVQNADTVLQAYASLPDADRRDIAECVTEMVGGMRALAPRTPRHGVRFVCDALDGLDAYCHFVAGTVGVMLSRLFSRAIERPTVLESPDILEKGRRFGLGLQATNIIKDHADDVARGVCFVPRGWVGAAEDGYPILPQHRAALIEHALSHLDQAMAFVLAIPSAAEEIRLFCLWALMLALGTLREAADGRHRTPKVGRSEVATILDHSRRCVGDDEQLRAWFADYRGQVTAALAASETEGAS
jgi:farnesyl-diphosphate farnesyltransferase